ncbi:hypothetical protein GW17_00014804 [Ensete ventricosum]|nr:hypothetical protein GW17_00014804 [Ensete ventricosum]
MPSPLPLPSLRRRRCPAQAAALHAVGMGSLPYDRCCYPRAAPRGRAMPPCAGAALAGAAALAGSSPSRGAAPCGLAAGSRPLQAPAMPAGDRACWRLSLQGPLAVSGRPIVGGLGRSRPGQPCMGAGYGWPPLLLVAFAAKTQEECIE